MQTDEVEVEPEEPPLSDTSFAELVEEHTPAVYRLARSVVQDSALADDVVQIPMVGIGMSLNVAVAGSLVAYRLAGLS